MAWQVLLLNRLLLLCSAGIIVGMLMFGFLGDMIGRCWGSRVVATVMLTGTILLTFAPMVSDPATYLNFYIFAATW